MELLDKLKWRYATKAMNGEIVAQEKIDSIRKNYYLEPLKELRKKAEFHYERDRRFGFGGYSGKYDTDKGEEDLLKIKTELLEQGFILYKKLKSEKAYHKK